MPAARQRRRSTFRKVQRRLVAGAGGLLLATAGLVATTGAAPSANADTVPPVATIPATVSADALPTVQINGVVWSQVAVGNTVYATGSFTAARPAGAAAGTSLTTRNNLLAYNLTTGALISTFNRGLNAQGIVVAASPDGSRVYVGGDFTSVSGAVHNRIVEIDTATGALISTFAPALNARDKAIAATNTTVYVAGSFTTANGVARARLAAFNPSNGALLTWAPTADNNSVAAMVLAPSGREVIVGGQFTSLNHRTSRGLGALDPATGATLPWAATSKVSDSGTTAGITSLRTDGTQVYGTGFVYGPGGNLEGAFAADPDTGVIRWIEDCHGDTYDSFSTGSVVYTVGHAHFCGNIGGFPGTNPTSYHHALAFTTLATGTIAHNTVNSYYDWFGNPDPTLLDWYPTLSTGTYTGQHQAAWSLAGNASYVVLGGEFPTVNGTGQQGLVRFAVKSLAPNKVGPRPASTLTPTVVLSHASAALNWTATYDQDNQALTYKVVRDGKTATPVFTTTVNSTFWQEPPITWTDTSVVPGGTHSYRIYVYDPLGNVNSGSSVVVTIP